VANKIEFTVPLVPPSVNHYKVRYRNGRTVVSGKAIAFKEAVAVFCRGRYVTGKTFSVGMGIFLGKKDKGDVDNFPKLVLDGLADCGVFRNKKGERVSDAHVRYMVVSINGDDRPEQGLTEITVEALN